MTTALDDWPAERFIPPDNPRPPCGVITYTDPVGSIHVYLDSEEFCFYMEAAPDAEPAWIAKVLDRIVYSFGFEPIPEDECEPELTDAGWTRIYLVPIVAVIPDSVPNTPDRGYFGKAVCTVGAALLSAPVLVDLFPTISEVVAA